MIASTAQSVSVEAIYLEATRALAAGKRAASVADYLASLGVPPSVAHGIVTQAGKAKRAAFRKAGLKLFLIGVGLMVLGFLITSVTYCLASSGGLYVVAIGPFIAGAVNCLRGFFRMITG